MSYCYNQYFNTILYGIFRGGRILSQLFATPDIINSFHDNWKKSAAEEDSNQGLQHFSSESQMLVPIKLQAALIFSIKYSITVSIFISPWFVERFVIAEYLISENEIVYCQILLIRVLYSLPEIRS